MSKRLKKAQVKAGVITEEQRHSFTKLTEEVVKAYRVNRQPEVSRILGRAIVELNNLKAILS